MIPDNLTRKYPCYNSQKYVNLDIDNYLHIMTMPIVYVIFIADLFTSDLVLRPKIFKVLERKISDIPYDDIIIDFSNVKSMTPSFAEKYKLFSKKNKKQIHEVNIPLHLEKKFNR